jgi:raffinose/stachyose/melibiose transport system substrate-binding protein
MTAPVTSRRAVLAAGLATALGGATAACGSSGPRSAGGSGGGSGASVWIISGVTEKAFRNSFSAWNAAHHDRRFSVEGFANDPYKQKIRVALGAHHAPTLVYNWGGGVLDSYVKAGSVEDLGDLAADPEVRKRFLPSIAAAGQVGGRTYALPNNGLKPVMIYYNKDLFAKVKAEPPQTWGELMALVPKFRAAGIAPFTVSGQAKWPLLPWLSYLMDRIGGPGVLAAILAGRPKAWSDPAVLEANRKIQQLVHAGGFVKGFASISTDSGADVALLYTGKAAMTLALPLAYQTIQTAQPSFVKQGRLGWFPFPAVEGGKGDPADVVGNPSNFWSIASSATAAQKKTAREYLRGYLLNKQYAADLLAVGNVPPVAGLDGTLAHSSDPEYFRTIYHLAVKAPHFHLSLDQALDPQQGDAVLTNLQQVFLGSISPEKFSAAMNATLHG